MEKSKESRPKEPAQEDLPIQDLEIYQEKKVDSDDLQSNRQEPKSKKPTQNVIKQDFLPTNEENEESYAEKEGLNRETNVNVKQKVERSAENSPVRTQDLIQTIQLEAYAVHQECDELAEDEMLKPDRNISVHQVTERQEELLIAQSEDSISTAEHDSSDAALQERDRIVKNEQLEANGALQQRSELPRKPPTLSPKKEFLQQPCQVAKENVKVRKEQDIVTQQGNTTREKVSETPAEAGATPCDAPYLEMMQREQELRKILAYYFSKQNPVTVQQKTEIPKEILIAPAKDSLPTAGYDTNGTALKKRDRIARKEQLEANSALKQSELPVKLPILNSKKGLQQNFEISEENAKARKEKGIETQQENAARDKVSETPAEAGATPYDAQDQERMLREQEMRKMLTNYFSNHYQVNQQETVICHQKNTHSFDNLQEIETQKLKETLTFGEPEVDWNGYARELGETLARCYPDSEDNELPRSQELKDDATGCHPETKEGNKLEYDVKPKRPQSSKVYVTLPKRDSDAINAHPQKLKDDLSGFPRGSNDASVHPQKTKDYVTFPRRESSVTALSQKTKDYVTHRPRISDNETVHTKISEDFSPNTELKRYVTSQSQRQKTPEPPTHIPWPLLLQIIQERESVPGSSTQVQKPASSPESEESPRVSSETQQLEGNKKASSLPIGTRLRQALTLQSKKIRPVPEIDDLPLVTFEEVGPEAAVETNEPGVQRNRRILEALMPPLSTGTQDFVQRFSERHIPAERQASFKKLSTGCMVLFYSLLVGGIVAAALYFVIAFVMSGFDIGGSNATSPLHDSHLNLDVPVTDAKHYNQSESLYGEIITPGTHSGITEEVDSNVNFITPDFDDKVNNSFAALDAEIIPEMNGLNDNVNTHEINSESNVITLVTDSDVD